jgi:hypothetical protein
MCLRIRSGAVTLFAAITIWSALSTGATDVGWPVRIVGMQAAPVTATVERRRWFRAMQLRVCQHTGPESRQDTQLLAMQPQAMQHQAIQLQATQPRERCISPALLPDSLGTARAPALRALPVGHAPPRQRPYPRHHRSQLQLPHSVTHVGKR